MPARKRPERRHDLDWLRVIAILLLLYYHVGMIFVSWGWHIQSPVASPLLESVMMWLHRWRMPLLFFISGAGTRFALGFRSPATYVKERTKRLLLPLVFGMLVVVPPQVYLERADQFASFWVFYPTVFDFVPYPEGSFSWHHLWFVAYLFCYSLLALPLFVYLRRPEAAVWRERLVRGLQPRGALLALALPILGTEALLRPFFPEATHALVDDWATFAFNLWFFVYGYVVCTDDRLWCVVEHRRRLSLYAALGATAALYAVYWDGLAVLGLSVLRPVAWHGLGVLMGWFWVLALIGYGKCYLNRPARWLPYANEGLYPFYILHQTVIVAIGVVVIEWPIGLWAQFAIVSTASLVLSIGLYVGLIRPVPWLRPLFGVKRLVRSSRAAVPAE